MSGSGKSAVNRSLLSSKSSFATNKLSDHDLNFHIFKIGILIIFNSRGYCENLVNYIK